MRGLIIDHVRKRRALKRGGEFHLTALNTQIEESVPELNETEMTSLDDALKELIRTGDALPDITSRAALERSLRAATDIFLPDPQRATAGIHFA